MIDDTKIAIETRCHITTSFGLKSIRSNHQLRTGPIGRSQFILDRSEIDSVQVNLPVDPVRLHLKKCRSYALDRTGLRPNRGCASLPRTDYAAIIWHRPGDTKTAPTTSQLRVLASMQGEIMRAIAGCFRTTAIKALEHETALLSPK